MIGLKAVVVTLLVVVGPLPPVADALQDEGQKASTPEAVARQVADALATVNEQFKDVLRDDAFKKPASHFDACQAGALEMAREGVIQVSELDRFYNGLDETLRALDQAMEGSTAIPPKSAGALSKRLIEIREDVRKTKGMEPVENFTVTADTSAADVVAYAERVFVKVDVLVFNRGLKAITGEGSDKTKKYLSPALKELRDAIAALVDERGQRVLQVDEDGATLKDQLACVKIELKQLKQAADVLCNEHSYARERVELALKDIERLEKNLLKAKSLTARPSKS